MRWPWKKSEDPYWDFFLNAAPVDPDNQINNAIRQAKPGVVFPVENDIHSAEAMSRHVKELGRFFGASATGIVQLPEGAEEPFAIVVVLPAEVDPRTSPGFGGQAPVTQGLFVTFNIAAVIREWGRRATTTTELDAEALARTAGLKLGPKTYVADAIVTNLPLAPDGATSAAGI